MENLDEFEETHNIEETPLYKKINKDDNGDILNDSDAKKISEIRSNKKKKIKKKKKKTRKSCKNKKNNNNNNGNNNNGYILKIEESEVERQTLENKETKKETYNTLNKKENNNSSDNSRKFPGSYLEFLNNDGLSANLSQKSTNNSEKKVTEHISQKIIFHKSSNSFFLPDQKENIIFPKVQNENTYFDLSQTIEMEKKIKEYDKDENENIIKNVEEINVNNASSFLDDVNNKFKKIESKNNEQNINLNKCINTKTEFHDSDKKKLVLLGKKKKRKYYLIL
jgi:hypothetical protein